MPILPPVTMVQRPAFQRDRPPLQVRLGSAVIAITFDRLLCLRDPDHGLASSALATAHTAPVKG